MLLKRFLPFRRHFSFSRNHMITSYRQRRISVTVISIVNTSLFCSFNYSRNNSTGTPFFYRNNFHFSIPLQNYQYDNFSFSTPAHFPFSSSYKCRPITLNFTLKWFIIFFRYFCSKPKPINRNYQNKIFQKFPFSFLRNPERTPDTLKSIPVSISATLKSSIFKFPCPMVSTFWTLMFHKCISYKIFGLSSLAIT